MQETFFQSRREKFKVHIADILEKRCEIEKSQWRGIQSKEARARKFVLSVARFLSNLKNRGQLRAWSLRFGFFVRPMSRSPTAVHLVSSTPTSIIYQWKILFCGILVDSLLYFAL